MFYVDDSGTFDAPLPLVGECLASRADHRGVHHHRPNRLETLADGRFGAGWEQGLWGGGVAFTMRGTTLHPTGLAYEILEGPWAGSALVNYFTAVGDRTRVTLVGEFTSPTIPAPDLEGKVRSFYDGEFREDSEGLAGWIAGRRRPTAP